MHVILVARSGERLQAVADEVRAGGGEATVVEADLTAPGAASALHEQTRRDGFDLDLLINNAGFGTYGPFVGIDTGHEAELIDLNIGALTELCHRFLPDMVARGRGKVLNIASTAAFQPTPFMATYGASKAYVLNLSIALNEELRGTGVSVCCLCPGATRTEFFDRAGMRNTRLQQARLQSPEAVVATGLWALDRKKAVAVSGWANKVLVQASRFAPRVLAARIAAALIQQAG